MKIMMQPDMWVKVEGANTQVHNLLAANMKIYPESIRCSGGVWYYNFRELSTLHSALFREEFRNDC